MNRLAPIGFRFAEDHVPAPKARWWRRRRTDVVGCNAETSQFQPVFRLAPDAPEDYDWFTPNLDGAA